jgi:hypothetical protein
MKSRKIFVYCECCDKQWESVLDTVDVGEGNVLEIEDESCVNVLDSDGDIEGRDIGGIYCGISCFTKHLKKVIKDN